MKLSGIIATFAAAVLAAVIGWFGGDLIRGAIEPSYETALGVVDAEVGAPVATASPTPSAQASATPESSPTETPEPEETEGSIICEGPPPAQGCDCDLEDGEWVWRCPLETTAEPVATLSPAPTP
jgi:hypothetical protein